MSRLAGLLLRFVAERVFEIHVRFGSGRWRRVLPGEPGAAPASTWPECVSFHVVGAAGAGQPGAGMARSRFQQVMKAASPG